MSKQLFTHAIRRAIPVAFIRYATTPLVRPRANLVAVKLVNDPHRQPRVSMWVGVRRESGQIEWLPASHVLTDAEARDWVNHGFAEAANDAA